MAHFARFTSLLLALVSTVRAVPTPVQRLTARNLLGSSFGALGNANFDYVIVGGGNAGLTVAARLAEDHSKLVAVIEAGSFYEIDNGNLSQIPFDDIFFTGKDPHDVNPLVDWGFVTTPQPGALNASLHYARGKTLGGCSARNYMTYQRGTTESYKKWADMVGDDSYTFDQWLPYFEKSLHFTPPDASKRFANATPDFDLKTIGNAGGPLSVTFPAFAGAFSTWVLKGLKELGINPINGFTSGKLLGVAYPLATIDGKTQIRDSSETAFLQPALKSNKKPNLIVYQSTLAKKILFDANKKATGVLVDTDGVTYTLSAKTEVIVSAGAFQSPQLLMVSGVGPAATLQKHNIPVVADRSGVGQNMWDHILFGPSSRVDVITGSALGNADFREEQIRLFNEQAAGILTNPGIDIIAWEKIPKSLRSSFPNSTISDLSTFPSDWPEVEYLFAGGFFGFQENLIRDAPTDGFNYASTLIALVAPLSRGTISISSADTADPPIINPNWLTHPADQAVAVAGYKRARQIINTNAMKPILIGPEFFPGTDAVHTDAQILDIIRRSFGTVFHASATCAMGRTNDPKAVVDTKARVIGVSGLRVVDAAAFPLLPPGHPMATVYALAEKIADDIKKGY